VKVWPFFVIPGALMVAIGAIIGWLTPAPTFCYSPPSPPIFWWNLLPLVGIALMVLGAILMDVKIGVVP
jgi:hypothetical protein